MTGILVIDKPGGWTSHDVIAKLRGLLGVRRIGHSGTLDPMATGVLPVFVGRATRAVQFATADEKEYIAGLRLGIVTDTQDIWGSVLHECAKTVDIEELKAALDSFKGEISQIPPMYSAVKKDGKKLYELARKGITVERQPRQIHIRELELLSYSENSCVLRVICSKGTYIRTLCNDIGEKLEVGGVMESLRRTRSGIFSLSDAVKLEEIGSAGDRSALLKSLDYLFAGLPVLKLNSHEESRHRNGQKFNIIAEPGEYRVYSGSDGTFLSISRVIDSGTGPVLELIKSFYPV